MKKTISVFLTVIMLLKMMPLFVSAEAGLTLSSPAEGAILDSSYPITLNGTLPDDTAKISIDDIVVADNITAADGRFSETVDLSACVYGIHKITLTCGDESIERYVHFTAPAVSELRGKNFTGGSGATSSNMGGWGCTQSSNLTVNNPNEYTIEVLKNAENENCGRTYRKHKDGYIRVIMNNNRPAESIDTGVFCLEADIAVSGTTPVLQLAVRDRGGSGGYYLLDNLVSSDSTGHSQFADGSTFEAGRTYHVKIMVDIDHQSRTYIVDDAVVIADMPLDRSDKLSAVNHFYFELPEASSADAALSVSNLTLTTIERYPVITGISGTASFSEQTPKDLWRAEISSSGDSAYIRLSGKLVSDSVNNINVQLLKNGAAVEANASLVGSSIIKVTPASGFEAGAEYCVDMQGLTYSVQENNTTYQKVYPSVIHAEMYALAVFAVEEPRNGALYTNENIPIVITVPELYTLCSVVLDEQDITDTAAVVDGVYSHDIAFEELYLGMHSMVVTALDDNGVQSTTTLSFETSKILSDIKSGIPTSADYASPTAITACTGSDGKADSGFKMTAETPENNAVFMFTPVPQLANTAFVFEADIKRDEGQNIWLEADGNQAAKGGYIYGAFAFDKQFVKVDGTLLDTGITIDADKWYHFKVESNLATKECSVYVDGVLVKNGIDSDVGNIGMPENLSVLKVQTWCPGRTNGIYVSNLKVYERIISPNVNISAYSISENDDDFQPISDNTVSGLSKRLRLTLDTAFDEIDASKVLIDSMTAKAITVENGGKTLVITLGESLIAQSSFAVELAPTLKIKGKSLGQPIRLCAMANDEVLGISKVDFSVGDKKLSSAQQLRASDELKTTVTVKNPAGTQINGIFLVLIYEGARLVAMKGLQINVPANTPESRSAINLTLPTTGSEFSVECVFIDSFINRLALSKVWELT